MVFEADQFGGVEVEGVPNVYEVNQVGLLGITIHPIVIKMGGYILLMPNWPKMVEQWTL